MTAAMSASVPYVVKSSPEARTPATSARMTSVLLIFVFVLTRMSTQRRSRKGTWSGGRMIVSLFSMDDPAIQPKGACEPRTDTVASHRVKLRSLRLPILKSQFPAELVSL